MPKIHGPKPGPPTQADGDAMLAVFVIAAFAVSLPYLLVSL
jgi:hypothetical protein